MLYTIAEENYIKAIYHLQQHSAVVTTNALAAALDARPASITDMLKKLKLKQLLVYERYKGVALTETGQSVALNVVRRHRLWEFFLVTHLGFGWNQVHEVADQLEHVQSPLLTQRLDDFLGKPAFDPHGDPIPDESGKMSSMPHIPLINLPLGQTATVCAVAGQTNGLLDMLTLKNIALNTPIKVVRRFEFDSSIEVHLSNAGSETLSHQLASHILVQPVL